MVTHQTITMELIGFLTFVYRKSLFELNQKTKNVPLFHEHSFSVLKRGIEQEMKKVLEVIEHSNDITGWVNHMTAFSPSISGLLDNFHAEVEHLDEEYKTAIHTFGNYLSDKVIITITRFAGESEKLGTENYKSNRFLTDDNKEYYEFRSWKLLEFLESEPKLAVISQGKKLKKEWTSLLAKFNLFFERVGASSVSELLKRRRLVRKQSIRVNCKANRGKKGNISYLGHRGLFLTRSAADHDNEPMEEDAIETEKMEEVPQEASETLNE